ncbi:MAG: ribosome biogenesis GTPase Der [Gammaproteobacteria bacterium]
MSSLLAIVGRPNVGKSSLFNFLTGSKAALVADFSGLTRDRQYGRAKYANSILIDTGGIAPDSDDISKSVIQQTNLAIEEAEELLFMVDAKDGLVSLDEEIALNLRKTNKPISLIINKIDSHKDEPSLNEFDSLGFEKVFYISCSHNRGLKELEHKLFELELNEELDKPSDSLKISIIGRPNVGKSTFINSLLGEDRLLVSPESGTTRDSIEVPIKISDRELKLIDTAGIRRKRASKEKLEEFSISQSLESIRLSNVAIILIDSSESIVDQDVHLIGLSLASGSTVILAANKSDLLTKEERKKVSLEIERRLRFADYITPHFISAKRNKGLKRLINLSAESYDRNNKDISTNKLNSILAKALEQQPPSMSGRFRPKLRYVHAGGRNPLRIVVHGNNLLKLQNSYKRYLENFYRKELDLSVSVFVQFVDSDNPFKDKKNVLTERQKKRRKRIVKRRR